MALYTWLMRADCYLPFAATLLPHNCHCSQLRCMSMGSTEQHVMFSSALPISVQNLWQLDVGGASHASR